MSLSPLLFCLAIEPLAAAIRRETDFSGVVAGRVVRLYGHDILLFVSNPGRSILCLFRIINSFSKFSGYKVN